MNTEQIELRLFGDILPGDKTGYQTYLKLQPVFLGKHIYLCALGQHCTNIFLCAVLSQC